jgi:hypothetical protein
VGTSGPAGSPWSEPVGALGSPAGSPQVGEPESDEPEDDRKEEESGAAAVVVTVSAVELRNEVAAGKGGQCRVHDQMLLSVVVVMAGAVDGMGSGASAGAGAVVVTAGSVVGVD